MQDPFVARAYQLKSTLLAMEQEAGDEDLFSIGYMIPQLELVLEMAEYDPAEVSAEEFDHTYQDWLEMAFDQDGMEDPDRYRIRELWHQALKRTET
ncbi:YfcL protein [Kushneria sinocarnis]|uniref:YfcL protein n=1 Tax=Kushneria sinocarnis TaxID=595502 RepID=A0A420WYA4_9GAMM|nr:YfcL family protein [Kushneria sinocarnis]RKR06135.1 YfcL protein [Kushneria sinocarnis]